MASGHGRSEVPDSEDEPMTSSPVRVLQVDADKLCAKPCILLQERQGALQVANCSFQASAKEASNTSSIHAEGLEADQKDAFLDVDASQPKELDMKTNHASHEAAPTLDTTLQNAVIAVLPSDNAMPPTSSVIGDWPEEVSGATTKTCPSAQPGSPDEPAAPVKHEERQIDWYGREANTFVSAAPSISSAHCDHPDAAQSEQMDHLTGTAPTSWKDDKKVLNSGDVPANEQSRQCFGDDDCSVQPRPSPNASANDSVVCLITWPAYFTSYSSITVYHV